MTDKKNRYRIGVISDTHGKLPASLDDAFQKTDMILHAGDIGSNDILARLNSIAPTVAVRGNMDFAPDAHSLNKTETIQVGDIVIHLRHILENTHAIPSSANIDVVIFGHTHRREAKRLGTTLFLNPGSAGQRRHGNPLSVALLMVEGKDTSFTFIEF